MSKLGLITDTHYGIRNDNVNFYNYMQKSNDYFMKLFKTAGVKTVVHGGDLVDRRKYINYFTAHRMKTDFLDPWTKEFDMHIIPGNHDVYYKDTNKINSLDVLLNGYDINIVHEPSVINVAGTKILLLPWINPENEERVLHAISEKKAERIIGHLEIQGFQFYRGVVNRDGHMADLFAEYSSVYSGHFHHASSEGNITYLGAAYEFNWFDCNDPRGVSILDTETGKLEFHRNPYSIFQIYEYNDEANEKVIRNDIETGKLEKMRDNYVKIIVAKKTNPALLDTLRDVVESYDPIDIKVIDSDFITSEDDEEVDIENIEDTPTIIDKHVERVEIADDMKTMVKDKLRSVYNEAIAYNSV